MMPWQQLRMRRVEQSCSQSVDGVDHTLLTVAISQAVSVLETRVDAIKHGLAWRGKRRPCHGMVIGG